MTYPIEHQSAAHRFAVVVDGHECELVYRFSDGVMKIVHTGVPSAVGGRGIAAELVRAAFDAARANGWKVVPACSYAAAWVERHGEYADLLV
jgi:predicted GNAT family acetyltransferase